MIPIRYDFKFWTNSGYNELLQFDVDLTGYTVEAQFRRSRADTTVLFTLNTVTTNVEGLKFVTEGIEMRVYSATLAAAYAAVDTNATVGEPVAIVADFVFTAPDTSVEMWIESVCEINYGVTR